MLIFSVYLSVCLMSQPEGWTTLRAKNKYINLTYFRASSAVEPVLFYHKRMEGNWDTSYKVKTPLSADFQVKK